jgi:hypothetical protein
MVRLSRRPRSSRHSPAPWLRELTELASVFVTVGAVHLLSTAVLHQPAGPLVLMGSGVALVRLRAHRRAGRQRPAARGDRLTAPPGRDARILWRIRTTVHDTPGSLAALCGSLSRLKVNILAIDLSPLGETVADELVLAAPADLAAPDLVTAVNSGHGTEVWISRADTRDLTDLPTRVLDLAADVAVDPSALPEALHELYRDCEISWLPEPDVSHCGSAPGTGAPGTGAPGTGAPGTGAPGTGAPGIRATDGGATGTGATDGVDGTTMRVRDPRGGVLLLSRAQRPFSPAELARARALAAIAAVSVPAR